jgi:hypothetical protein
MIQGGPVSTVDQEVGDSNSPGGTSIFKWYQNPTDAAMTAIKIAIYSQTDAFRCIARIVNPINPSKYNEIRYGPVLRDALITAMVERWYCVLSR